MGPDMCALCASSRPLCPRLSPRLGQKLLEWQVLEVPSGRARMEMVEGLSPPGVSTPVPRGSASRWGASPRVCPRWRGWGAQDWEGEGKTAELSVVVVG